MKQILFSLSLFLLIVPSLKSQLGNEWIDYSKTYYRFSISEDGIYRIPHSVLAAAGLGSVSGSEFRLYHLGAEVPLYTTTDGPFSGSDFIEFYGEQNRGEFDRLLFSDPDNEQLNPRYSLFTDASAYFLTVSSTGSGLRISQIPNELTNLPPAETYYMHKDEWVYSDQSLDPQNASSGVFISLSRHQEAEGFSSASMTAFSFDIASSLIASTGPDAQLTVRMASSSYTTHDIVALLNGDTLLNHANASGYNLYQLEKSIPAAEVPAMLNFNVTDFVQHATFSVANIQWTYPREFDFSTRNEAAFNHIANGTSQYFELLSFSHGGSDPLIYDRTNHQRLIGVRSGTTTRFHLPSFQGVRNIVVVSQADALHEVQSLTVRSFTDYSNDNAEYIIITHPSLRTNPDPVYQYAEYRRSLVGGDYEVGIYDILDLYDQFGYGIEKHPQAIRNFKKMIQGNWETPKMVLIIGKGIVYTYSRQAGSDAEEHLLVPTFGQPGADNLLFTDNGISLPPYPIGRLPVSNKEQLDAYLQKLIEYDEVKYLPQTLEEKGWTKAILHMGGGQDADQQAELLNYLNQMADTAIHSEYGAYAYTFSKSSTNTTGISNSDQIIQLLRQGLGIVKFFGHSSASTLDFQINNPREWANKGKYPIFSAMGCKSGDIHQDFLSLSESFVFEPDAGTIAFVAGSGAQYLSTLGNWGKSWYSEFGHGVSSMTLGETILESLGTLNQFGSVQSTLLIEQQTITGDPALRFHYSPGPDYLWDYQSVKYQPEVLTTDLDSFTLSADVVNIGLNYTDNVVAKVEQETPNGELKQVFFDTVQLSGFRTSLEFTIPMELTFNGNNTFYLTIDVLNETEELPQPIAEENNELANNSGKKGIDIFILDNRAQTTSPLEFSIVTTPNPELIATSSNAFVKGAQFVMEIDTTPEFNSPLKMREYFSGFGGVLRWKPLFPFAPGKVYYWRVSAETSGDPLWDTSSFLYNPGGESGWNQSHYGQFQKDLLDGLDFNRDNRIDFDTVYRNIWVQNKVDFEATIDDDPVVYINNRLRRDFFTFYSYFDAHVSVIVIDSLNGRFLRNPPGGLHGAVNDTTFDILLFPFNTATPESRNNLMTFLTDVVQDGQYVIMFSYQRPGYMDYFPEDWEGDEQIYGRSIFSVIEDHAPGSEIRSLAAKGAVPYLLYYRKNMSMLHESVANVLEETLSFDYNFISHASEGLLTSTLIGPAKHWKSMEWSFDYSDNPSQDKVAAQLLALSASLADTLRLDISALQDTTLEFIDANEYPFMYLTFQVEDVPNLTAPAIDYWRVLFEGVPDLLIDPNGGFDFEGDSLMVGQPMNLTTNIENLGADAIEAFLIRFVITDEHNNTSEIISEVPPLATGQSHLVHVTKEMVDGAGRNSLFVEINPDRTVLEASYMNNTGILNFVLIPDRTDPFLEVTVDGRHLANGDIVSSEPVIVAELTDDNNYQLLDDKTAFEIMLAYPNDFVPREIDINSAEVTFEPANSQDNNRARIVFRPTLEEGLYDLLIRAHDRSGNWSGSIDYAVSFEVIGSPVLSNVEVEPTVFFDYSTFSFLITGTEIPSEINLQISDISGRIVRTIGKEEISLFVGTNEYVWNGTTDSGEPLPGGVYFYSLTARDYNGREYLLPGSGIRKLRNARVGKIVIVR